MIQLIKSAFLQFIDDIDSGNSNITEELLKKILEFALELNRKELSKLEAASYIGVSRATFDNYITRGWIPKGLKRQGFKELSWNKSDLDNFLKNEIIRKRL